MGYIGNPVLTAAYLTDQFSGNGSTTSFTLSVAPATSSSILVSVSGVLQDPTTYAVVGTALNFSGAPPTGTGNISVRYLGIPASGVTTTAYRTITEFTATAGQTTFTPPSYTIGFIAVYRNGVRLGAADYTASNGTTIVLTTGATAGDLITTESFYVSSVLNAIPNTPGAVVTSNIADNAITTAKIAPGAVIQADLATGVAGNGPAFSAYLSSTQSISANTQTKVQFQTKEFDTASCYDNTTNYRFTPNVAGYYQVNAAAAPSSSQATMNMIIYKNGSAAKRGTSTVGSAGDGICTSALIYMNGTTDYLEAYWVTSVTQSPAVGSVYTYFQASLARAA